jgi:uncharacterized membrane protein
MSASPQSTCQQDDRLAPVYRAAITVMTWGFRTGAALLVIGLAIAAAKRESINHEVDPFSEIFPNIFDGKAAGIIDLAILALMVTPLITVVTVAVGFRRAGDRRCSHLSFVVLGILGISVLLSMLR